MVKGTTKTKAAKVSAKKKKEEEEEVDEEEGEGVNVEAMTVAQLKEELSQVSSIYLYHYYIRIFNFCVV